MIKLLIVEDDMIIAAKISMQLTNLGYEVTGIVPRGEEAILHVEENKPDIVLLDINLKGTLDGIETARIMHRNGEMPIIFFNMQNCFLATRHNTRHLISQISELHGNFSGDNHIVFNNQQFNHKQ